MIRVRATSTTSQRGEPDLALARVVAGAVPDPELPMLTLADLGVLHRVEWRDGRVVVGLIPTYAGCPALAAMRDDVVRVLQEAGFDDVAVRIDLSPAWSSDLISARGRKTLQEHGIAPPHLVADVVPLQLGHTRVAHFNCPRCDSDRVELISQFGPTPCASLARCLDCRETFEHIKEH